MKHDVPGSVRLAVCLSCGHRAGLPLNAMLTRFGELETVERAISVLRCTACGRKTVEARLAKLCEPGCPRQRG